MLNYIGEGKEPSLTCEDSTYVLDCGSVLPHTVQFLYTFVIILGKRIVSHA